MFGDQHLGRRGWYLAAIVGGATLAWSVGIAGARAHHHHRAVPDLTGSWVNQSSSANQVFQLHSSASRMQLTGTWRGAYPHQAEVSNLSANLNGAHTAYVGTVHNTEGSVTSTGTMTLKIVSSNQLSCSYKQSNGYHSTFTLVRKRGGTTTTTTSTTTTKRTTSSTTATSTAIAVASSGAGPSNPPNNPGPGSTTHYYGGPKNGNVVCGGAAMHPGGQSCTVNQQVNVQGNATITGAVDQPLASGQQLVIVYDSGNGADPEFQKCLPGYTTSLGCVIAATNGQSVQVQIPIPSAKTNWGGVHYLSMIAEGYPATQPAAEIDLALCDSQGCG